MTSELTSVSLTVMESVVIDLSSATFLILAAIREARSSDETPLTGNLTPKITFPSSVTGWNGGAGVSVSVDCATHVQQIQKRRTISAPTLVGAWFDCCGVVTDANMMSPLSKRQ